MTRRVVSYGLRLALLWCCWWVIGAIGIHVVFNDLRDGLRQSGYAVEADLQEVTGFPARFDVALAGVAFADPRAGVAWRGNTLTLAPRAWNPLNLTAIWPERHRLTIPAGRYDIRSATLETSVVFRPGRELVISRFTLKGTDVVAMSNAGFRVALAEGSLSASAVNGGMGIEVTADLAGFEPPRPLRLLVDPARRLPQAIDRLTLDTAISFDRPWNRGGRDPAVPTAVDLQEMNVRWGTAGLVAKGGVQIDVSGIPEGRIDLTAINWREILALAVSADLVPRENAAAVERGLALLASEAGQATLSLPLVFSGGRMSIGPVPIGPAPVIRFD